MCTKSFIDFEENVIMYVLHYWMFPNVNFSVYRKRFLRFARCVSVLIDSVSKQAVYFVWFLYVPRNVKRSYMFNINVPVDMTIWLIMVSIYSGLGFEKKSLNFTYKK